VKRLLVIAALLTLASPAAFAAPPAGKGKPEGASSSKSGQSPAALCKAERAADPGAFAKKYGTNASFTNAFGKCVSSKSKGNEDESGAQGKQDQSTTSNAAKQCKKERADLGAGAFAAKYGTNANKRNAFGKCVSSKVKVVGKQKDDVTEGNDESNDGHDDSGD